MTEYPTVTVKHPLGVENRIGTAEYMVTIHDMKEYIVFNDCKTRYGIPVNEEHEEHLAIYLIGHEDTHWAQYLFLPKNQVGCHKICEKMAQDIGNMILKNMTGSNSFFREYGL